MTAGVEAGHVGMGVYKLAGRHGGGLVGAEGIDEMHASKRWCEGLMMEG